MRLGTTSIGAATDGSDTPPWLHQAGADVRRPRSRGGSTAATAQQNRSTATTVVTPK